MTKDSRLERFLKALCSLDYSDLPTPLSRVEVLWNCLITGEAAPDFQPQSRTEKYLMTILGVYDLEDIPKPISRVETLLYKLATGDTDVEMEGGAKSRYERLLSEIVANGGVGDNVDFEYVTYVLSESFNTLYNTVEKPVKSAILSGQTLVNLHLPVTSINANKKSDGTINNIYFRNNSFAGSPILTLKPSTKYLLKVVSPYKFSSLYFNVCQSPQWMATNNNQAIYTTLETFDQSKTYIHAVPSETISAENIESYLANVLATTQVLIIEYQEGMENWDIPYFEGMQSVKMPVLSTIGKNLFDGELVQGYLVSSSGILNNDNRSVSSANFIKVNGDEKISISQTSFTGDILLFNYDENKNFLGTSANHGQIMAGSKFIKFRIYSATIENLITNQFSIQVEKGSLSTTYEPYKSNILTVNEEVELRKVGDIQDELDLSTGKLTQRIGEIVLDGSEGWVLDTAKEKTQVFRYESGITMKGYNTLISDKFVVGNQGDTEKIVSDDKGRVYIAIDKTIANTVSTFKTWLANNNVLFQYQLATESIKTVDLSTLDQDGNKTKLKTFNDITHVSLSSEGLIPEAELTVATKNLDDISQASTMSLRMNDISDKQNELQNEADMQSENIDSTMMATTEIYEQTL